MSPPLTPQIPKDELDRLGPLVERLLSDFRQRTDKLPPERGSALIYTPVLIYNNEEPAR